MKRIVSALIALLALVTAGPAHAAPVVAAIGAALAKITLTKIIVGLVISVATSLAMSGLKKVLGLGPKKPTAGQRDQNGLRIERRATGGAVPRSFIVGEYATEGSDVCPPMSHGVSGETPNAYLTQVVAITDKPNTSLNGVIVNGEFIALGALQTYGYALTGKYAGNGWVRFYDGTQSTADAQLVANYGGYTRPWTSNHIGKGVSYAILTWLFNADVHKSEPSVRFIVSGLKLYDPRKDSSIGGSGSHRFDNPATWEFTRNNAVIIYNIKRGITFDDGSRWGGECSSDDLPLANWAAAMNVCDEVVSITGGTEPRYRCGYEIFMSDEPADIIEELLKSCHGAVTEIGGVYKIRVGPTPLPSMFITDDDILVSREQDYAPLSGIGQSRNVLNATYVNPAEGWNTHDAPQVRNEDAVTADGMEHSGTVQFPAVPYPLQVQRLMRGLLYDDRRELRHTVAIGHYAAALEPLDTIAWTSAFNQYTNKLFEIDNTDQELMTLTQTMALREVDPTDYNYVVGYELPDPIIPPVWNLPATQQVPGFAVAAWSVKDAANAARRPAIRATWTALGAIDATALKIQVRVQATAALLPDITVTNVTDGERIIADGILPSVTYQVRALYIADRPTDWTAWISVTTSAILLDMSEVNGLVTALAELNSDIEDALDTIADVESEIATLISDMDDVQADIIANANDIDTIEYRTLAGNPNLLPNGSGENGLIGWTVAPGVSVVNDIWGPQFSRNGPLTGAGFVLIQSDAIPVSPNVQYTISMDAMLDNTSNTANMYCDVIYYNASNAIVLDGSQSVRTGPFAFSDSPTRPGLFAVTDTSPATATYARVRVVAQPNGATINKVAARRIKFEKSAQWTGYSAEASTVMTFTSITSLSGSLATLSIDVDALESTVSIQGTAIDTLESDYASLSITVGTQGVNITSNTIAISSLDTRVGVAELKLRAGNPNLLKDGGFTAGLTYWPGRFVAAGETAAWSFISGDTFWGNYIYLYDVTGLSTGFHYVRSDRVSLGNVTGLSFTLTADCECYLNSGGSASLYVQIRWYNSSDVFISYTSGPIVSAPRGFDPSGINREALKLTATAPSGAYYARIELVANVNNAFIISWRQAKFEYGNTATPFTQEATIAQTFTVFSDLDTNLASLESEVSTQGATITTQQTAIDTIESDMVTSFARVALRLDVGGKIIGYELNNNGVTGNAIFSTDYFGIVSPTGTGPRLEYYDGALRAINGAVMNVMGAGFGTANQFVQWFGPYSADLNDCTETGAIFYLKTDGSAHFDGTLSSSTLKNEATSTVTSPTAHVIVGPFTSIGDTISVLCSASYVRTQYANAGTGGISGSGNGTVTVEWSDDGSAWTLLTSFGVNEDQRDVVVDGDPFVDDVITWGMSGGTTTFWTPGASATLYVRATWTFFSLPTISGTDLTAPVAYQRTSVITIEQP